MGKKSRRKSKPLAPPPPAKRASGALLWASIALLLIGTAALYVLRQSPARPAAASTEVQARQDNPRPFYDNPEDAKPFPRTMDPSRFDISFVSEAYSIARQIPEVLVQQPCDCNCGVLGHRSLLDCYVSYHAATCAACLKEAILTQRMTEAGRSPEDIRADIDQGLWRSVVLESTP